MAGFGLVGRKNCTSIAVEASQTSTESVQPETIYSNFFLPIFLYIYNIKIDYMNTLQRLFYVTTTNNQRIKLPNSCFFLLF